MSTGKCRTIKNPFSTHEKAKHWHPTLNEDVTPNNISIHSEEKFHFKCPTCNHNFEQYIKNITKKNKPNWCPYCTGRKLCDNMNCNMCKEKSMLSSKKIHEWCYLTNPVSPRMVFKSTATKYNFNCANCPHRYSKSPNSIENANGGCPYCCEGRKRLCDDMPNCDYCYENSLMSLIDIMDNYCYEKNEHIDLNKLTKGTRKKIYWNCDYCHESFEMIIKSRIKSYNKNLPCFCKNCMNMKKGEDCAKSIDDWQNESNENHKNNFILHKLKNINCRYNNLIGVDCKKHNLGFKTILSNHLNTKNGGCPECINKRKKEIAELSTTTFEEFSRKSNERHNNEYIYYEDTYTKIANKTKMKHKICGETCWRQAWSHMNGCGCICEVNKTEAKLVKWLKEKKNTLNISEIIHGYKPDWLKEFNNRYEYDIYIKLTNEIKIIIEVDGPQHYKYVTLFKNSNVDDIQRRDREKEKLADQNRHNLLRVNQEDIWKNKNNWENDIIDFIKKKYENNDEINIYDCADGKRYLKER